MKLLSFSVKIYQTKAFRAIVTKNLKIFELRFLFVSEYSQVFKAETTSKPVRIFRVVLLFSYQRTLCLCELVVRISDSLFILPYLVLSVKNFFNFFLKTFLKHFFSSKVIIPDRHRFILATFFILTPCKVFVNSFLRIFSFF